jgi:NADPH-dependent glutamate synthase beta subunit-like oxidoreductase/dihydroorotate dehydrogenase/Pyruvate/2-oxoacid:ferredoxin oxidoreductase delta subunit
MADELFLTDAQLIAESERCEFCEEKPCKEACPADCSPADFIMAIRQGTPQDFARSAAMIMTRNPLGGVCGGVCPDTHCQAACVHRRFDGSLEIPAIQAAIVARAKKLGVMPKLALPPANGRKVAVIGAGPAGIGAASTLAQNGYHVEIFEAWERAGGACSLVPEHRLPASVLSTDIEWAFDHPCIHVTYGRTVQDPATLLQEGFAAVIVAAGLHKPINLGIPGEELLVPANGYLKNQASYPATGAVAVIGGGAIACDCAVTARLNGACRVELFALETLAELPMTPKERQLLLDHTIDLSGRTRVLSVLSEAGRVCGLEVAKVQLPAGEKFHPAAVRDIPGTSHVRKGFDLVLLAIGNRPTLPKAETPGIFFAGDGAFGPSTVVEAVATGKNAASQVHAWLARVPASEVQKPRKSRVIINGYKDVPVSLETNFFGRMIPSPFLLSAAPPSDGHDQMVKAYEAGWAGGIMKTAFDNVPIHIPAGYMHVFDSMTYGNCDNVSGHPLDRVCREIERLNREWPDRLNGASTGGPLTGNDAHDKLAWQSNMKKLEDAGAGVVEFSLSCPQGGDGTEGDIVSQNARLTAKIIDWLMETSRPEIPKLFKLTAAVTSIQVILQAVKEVLDRYPGKNAGVTLANTFPTLSFRPRRNGGKWDEAIVVGMSGAGVAPISYLTLASVARSGVVVSGNGGPMDYRMAANFLALGARSVQFCTVAMKYGVGIIRELESGLSHLMKAKGIASVEQLIGYALPKPITDFMELPATKQISASNAELCMSCGNCTRCPYLAISLDADQHPQIDASKCIGCSLCTKRCFAAALFMRDRTPEELAVLIEH